ncbi:hypothetical protein K439DRAFT_1525740 [Ramaria rubella]|nr:hypothetical protein K439DRAFT_1525740 [Ramaria rubella]
MRPDNVFCSEEMFGLFISCKTYPDLRPPCADHFPIESVIDVSVPTSNLLPGKNWRQVDWPAFQSALQEQLNALPAPSPITSREEFDARYSALMAAIDRVTAKHVPDSKHCPHTKRWWTKELSQAKGAMR